MFVVSIFFVPSRTQPCSLSGLATLFGGTNLFERHVVNLNTSELVARRWQNPMEKKEMEAGLCKLLHKLFTQQPSIHPILAPPGWAWTSSLPNGLHGVSVRVWGEGPCQGFLFGCPQGGVQWNGWCLGIFQVQSFIAMVNLYVGFNAIPKLLTCFFCMCQTIPALLYSFFDFSRCMEALAPPWLLKLR